MMTTNSIRRQGGGRLLWVGLLVALLVAACAAPAAPASTGSEGSSEAAADSANDAAAETEAVTPDNTLLFAADMTDLISLDPAVAYEFGGIVVVGNIYETLVSFDPGDPEIKPLLAESWDVGEEGDQWVITFHLNPNATFASGNPVTAQDVLYSWSRAIDLNMSPAFLFTDVAQLTKENMAAIDEQTFEVKLPKNVSPPVFLSVISFSLAAVLEQAALEANAGDDMGSAWLNDNSAGSGPYVLDTWERSVNVTINANPNYWGAAPAMKRVVLQNTPELANLQSAIETGDADIVQDLGPEQVEVLQGNPDIQLVTAQSSIIVYLGLNATESPLDNPDVREAIRYAINYDELITLLKGNGQLVQEFIPIGFLGHTGMNPFTQDIEKAKELLAGAGLADGFTIDAIVPVGTAPGGIEWSIMAAKIQNDLAQVGITLNLQQLQQSELLNIYRAQEGKVVFMNWGPDFPDPDGNATPFTNFEANSLAWRNEWNDAQAIELSKQAAAEQDPETRVELYQQLTDYVQHNGPYVLLYQPTRTFGLRSNVQGFVYDPVDTPSITFAAITK
ncbi:MAG: ABC transporter substrate-binding protein [Caldilineaceae bacterium]